MGYVQVKGKKHLSYKHPDRTGKVSLDAKWTGVKAGGWVFRSLCRQTGYSKKELINIMNGMDP